MLKLNAKSLKVTCLLDPAEVAALIAPATARVTLQVKVDGRGYTADVAAKSLRKAQATIAEGDCVVLIQGKLVGDAIIEAGLVAQPKVAKSAAA